MRINISNRQITKVEIYKNLFSVNKLKCIAIIVLYSLQFLITHQLVVTKFFERLILLRWWVLHDNSTFRYERWITKHLLYSYNHPVWKWVYIIRSSYSEMFLVKRVLRTCRKFTGEHPCRSVISIKYANTDSFLVCIFLYSDWIRRFTP